MEDWEPIFPERLSNVPNTFLKNCSYMRIANISKAIEMLLGKSEHEIPVTNISKLV